MEESAMVSLASASDWLLVMPIILSLLVEDRYLSRPAIVTNTVSIFISTAHHWNSAGWFLQTYSVLGLLIGVTAFISYLASQKLKSEFYRAVFYPYHTIVAIIYVFVAGLFS
jgi:formate-dependent nitrite reductase membrane component NrfD